MPQNSSFRLPRGHRFFEKIGITVMGPKHCGDSLRSILGPMGSHWVQKLGQNREELPCPKIRIFDYIAAIDFSKENGSYSHAAISRWRTSKVHLGANRFPLGPKMGQNCKKLPCPKIRIFRLPCGHRFCEKNISRGYSANSGGKT